MCRQRPGREAPRGVKACFVVIPDDAKRRSGIHRAVRMLGEMDSGPGPSDQPGKTEEKWRAAKERVAARRVGDDDIQLHRIAWIASLTLAMTRETYAPWRAREAWA